MNRFVYAGWFRDHDADPGDEEYEWVACMLIEAESAAEANSWGDHLAGGFSRRSGHEEFIRSEVRPPDDPCYDGVDLSTLPVVRFGVDASDEHIGW